MERTEKGGEGAGGGKRKLPAIAVRKEKRE